MEALETSEYLIPFGSHYQPPAAHFGLDIRRGFAGIYPAALQRRSA